MEHHHHGHAHTITADHVSNAFVWGIVLNLIFVCVEVVAGLYIESLSLLSDAGHNLADVATLALSLFAIKMAKVKSNNQYTYGFKKTTILVALFNSVLLLVSIGAIGYEAIHRFLRPEPLPGNIISIVAGIGIGVNLFTALLFFKSRENDLNVKSAFLHLLSDAIVSAGIVIGGIIIFYTNYFWIDSVLSILVALVILFSTWSLLQDSLRLSLDGVPKDIDLDNVKSKIKKIKGVEDFHHIHIWAISTTVNALTAHLVVAGHLSYDELQKIKHTIRHELEHLNIHHVTLETEDSAHTCAEEVCSTKG
ncbi:MAG: cation transporter [Cytophagales bacterium]|nr:cation transporter [Cytophaga sp.]